jgi:hypothetical protein
VITFYNVCLEVNSGEEFVCLLGTIETTGFLFDWVGLCLGRNTEEWLEGRTPGCQLESAEKRNAPFPIRYQSQHLFLRSN